MLDLWLILILLNLKGHVDLCLKYRMNNNQGSSQRAHLMNAFQAHHINHRLKEIAGLC